MQPADMSYNTQQEFLIMPEYGRNVQQLVRHMQQIEDPKTKLAFCEEIIDLIQQLYPQSKSVEDYRTKLWQHLYQIAKFDLDVPTPTGVVPTPEAARMRPEIMAYPQREMKFKHYGNNVLRLINRAREMEGGVIKDGFVHTIGSYMKLAYKTWNREHYVSDDLIKGDLEMLSEGQLSLEENSRIDGLANATRVRNNVGRETTTNSVRNDRDRRSGGSNNNGQNRNRDGRNNSGSGGNRDNRNGSGGGNNNNQNRNRDIRKKK